MIRRLAGGLTILTLMALAAPILAQRDEPKDSGPLQRPKPYGDRGSTGVIGNPPIAYPNRPRPGTDPIKYWKDRIITSPYGGGTVIIINGSPCYTPWYYGYNYPTYYNDSYVYGGFQMGGINLGYGQRHSNTYYGSVYPQVQRPVDLRNQRQYDDFEERETPRTTRRDSDDDAGYYLHQKPRAKTLVEKDPSLSQAVANIERAFRSGDIRSLEPHVSLRENLALVTKGQSRKPLSGEAYLELTRDALKNLRTLKFELPNAEPASNGAMMVFGTHVIKAEDGKSISFSVSFVLRKRGDQWVITEVSADPAK